MKQKILLPLVCYLLIFLFVYASVNKVLDIQKFQVQIGQSPMLTDFAPFLAFFVPGVELIISVMLAIGRFRLFGLYGAFCLMVMFTSYIVFILQYSDDIPCSCGGVLESLGWKEHLVFNVFFVVVAGIGIVMEATLRNDKTIKYAHE